MTDNAPGWQTDPTGRHDHRYWDGSQWTEHVSDAGVATTDPYDGTAAPEPVAPVAPAEPTPAGAEVTADPEPEFTMTSESTDPAPASPHGATPSYSAASSQPTDASGSTEAPASPTASEPEPEFTMVSDPDTPATPVASYGSPVPPIAAERTGEPNEGASAPDLTAPDAPTVVQPTTADPTTDWPISGDSTDSPAPPMFTPPGVTDGSGGDDGSKRKLLIGVGIVAVIAILVAVFALGGGDDKGDLATSIASQMREGGQSGLDEKEAECLANELIKEIGADKLEGVDFTADEPPEGIADELNDAFVAAIPKCDIDLSDSGDDGSDGADASETDGETTDTALTPDQVEEFRDLLAEQYRDTLGLTDDQAGCLADTMADAIEAGELNEEDSFDQFFEYLDACDISVSDLGGTGGATP